MTEPPFDETLLNVWEEYRRCTLQSRKVKARLTRVRLGALALAIAGQFAAFSPTNSLAYQISPAD